MDQNNHISEQFREEDLPEIWKMMSELMEQDKEDNGHSAPDFLMSLPIECQSQLQWYVFGEHGEQEADKLYELLRKSPEMQSEVAMWVDTELPNSTFDC